MGKPMVGFYRQMIAHNAANLWIMLPHSAANVYILLHYEEA
jgi:hypothetical protein